MKIAIITGASSGIGLAISTELLKNQYIVVGIGRNFDKVNIEDNNFIQIVYDLNNTKHIENLIKEIKTKILTVDVLINCAGVGYFGQHEDLSSKKIEEMININLTSPLLITKYLLKDIKKSKGFIINIASESAMKSSKFGCVYSATKSALIQFGNSLFDEIRKSGAKVITIIPDITKTNFFNNLEFCPTTNEESYILPECIAQSIIFILQQRNGTVIKELHISPQLFQLNKQLKK